MLLHLELKSIKKDLSYLITNMVDPDEILTEEDLESIKEYEKDKKAGKLTSLEKVKEELGL